jgi:hypothetical protein
MRIRKYQRHFRREVCKGTTKFLTGKVDSAGILLIRTMRSIGHLGRIVLKNSLFLTQ